MSQAITEGENCPNSAMDLLNDYFDKKNSKTIIIKSQGPPRPQQRLPNIEPDKPTNPSFTRTSLV